MTNTGTRLSNLHDTLRDSQAALQRNLGTITEQDWRAQVERCEARIAAESAK